MIIFLSAIFGLIWGSFLNVVILRARNKETLLGRSHCVFCKKILRWFETIPVFSFLLQGGRCRGCGEKISKQYALVEITSALIFMAGALRFYDWREFIFFLVSANALLIIFVYDLKFLEIPDGFVFAPLALLLVLGWPLGSQFYLSAFFGVLLTAGFFGGQYAISRGRWIGAGDITFGLLLGVMLGWPEILAALFLAYVGGAVISLFLVAFKIKNLKSQMPFAVFLAPAALAVLLWGNQFMILAERYFLLY